MTMKWFCAALLLSCLTGCSFNSPLPNTMGPYDAAVSQIQISSPNNRVITTQLLLPKEPGAYPLVVFSQGAFASPDRYRKLLSPIASAGYIVVAPVHRDSEALASEPKAPPEMVWATRNEDMAVLADAPISLREALRADGYRIQRGNIGAAGHSYGALIAQLAAGAEQRSLDGGAIQYRHPSVGAVVAFSPPGQAPADFPQTDWSQMGVPSLTLTGTADVLEGFIDDWRDHLDSYEAQQKGKKWLWIGDGTGHYFGGVFGRERPVSNADQEKFDHALKVTILFLDCQLKNLRCDQAPEPLRGVQFTERQAIVD